MVKFLSSRDVRNTPGALWEALESGASVALTANGKPKALVIGVGEDDFEETLRDLGRIRFMRTFRTLQAESLSKGLDRLTEEEIEEIIRKTRAERSR
ncbi:MAG: type II toxin-antitoxin system Phd/YefM family antitoxin [Gemmatimonadetes bacterium]|jgi:antitoxin (DNA-binding transcriptional repressor) of toxin-antitoxin stability system|nr:type II toxin-antitoxin system Phd/YefM family antitoxin [Gemmatimonadota bacterium]MDQ3522354.1 type II toxin-antitoxin system Phd/YefM family antitoxin [Gemmatimonadota bacterium]